MKFIICSDIHGDFCSAQAVISILEREKADRLIILGDLLYHGPRNSLPEGYDPKAVIALLNAHSESILAVRGNCDTEVDQMVLNFPITSQLAEVFADGKTLVLTHGHKFDYNNPPPLRRGDFLLCGHTHVPARVKFGDQNTYLNPGSVSLPKNGFPKTYILYEDGKLTHKTLDGGVIEI